MLNVHSILPIDVALNFGSAFYVRVEQFLVLRPSTR